MNMNNLKLNLELDQTVTSCYDDEESSCQLNDAEKLQPSLLPMTLSMTTCDESEEEKEEFSDDEEDEDLDDIPVLSLFEMITDTQEDVLFAQHGYSKVDKICNTLQGELFKAEVVSKSDEPNDLIPAIGSYVAIKKVEKKLVHSKTAEQDGMTFCVSENIIKEALILKHLTVDNVPCGNYLVKYIDFFESEDDYYLVMEYIEGMNLEEFIQIAQKYLNSHRLSIKEYHKIVKFIMWQIITTLRFLHDVHHCCHLDVSLQNIMLQNVRFETSADGSISIPPSMGIKLCDFGVAELFNDTSFLCNKQGLNIDNEAFQAPKVFDGDYYDARAADMWSVGMIFYQLTTGHALYRPQDMWKKNQLNGYNALMKNELKQFFKKAKVLRFFNKYSFDLLESFLNLSGKDRISAFQSVQHPFFKTYYKQYQNRLNKKFKKDVEALKLQKEKMAQFPYYKM